MTPKKYKREICECGHLREEHGLTDEGKTQNGECYRLGCICRGFKERYKK